MALAISMLIPQLLFISSIKNLHLTIFKLTLVDKIKRVR